MIADEEYELVSNKIQNLLIEWKFLSLSKEKLLKEIEIKYDKEVYYEIRNKKHI